MVSGIDWLRCSFPSRVAKTARICSKRTATSRPFFSPASVTTVKWVEWISSHGLESAAAAGKQKADASRVRNSEMERQRGMCRGRKEPFWECYHDGLGGDDYGRRDKA